MSQNETKKFSLGRIVATPGALEALRNASQDAGEFLGRHVAGIGATLMPKTARQRTTTL